MGLGCTDVLGARHGDRWVGKCACGRGEVRECDLRDGREAWRDGTKEKYVGTVLMVGVRLCDKKGWFRGSVNIQCQRRGWHGELLRFLGMGILNV